MSDPTIPNPKHLVKSLPKDTIHPSKREDEINRMCDSFEANFNVPNKIHYKEMRKFEPLFSMALRQKVEDHTLSNEEEFTIARLSSELMSTLNNMYSPIHVVDDEGKDVMPPLPPLFSRIHTLSGNGNTAIQILFNALNRDDSTPMGYIQQKKATTHLMRLLSMSQNAPEVMENIKKFNEMIEKHNVVSEKKEEERKQREENKKINIDRAAEDLLDFDDD